MQNIRKSLVRGTAAIVLGACALIPVASVVHADSSTEVDGPNIVANGGFERGADPGVKMPLPAGAPLLDSWTTFGTELYLYGTFWQAEEGTRSLAMTNPTTAITTGAGVKQSLTTTVGQQYRVIFYQAGNPAFHEPSTLRVQIGGYSHDYTYQSDAKASLKNMEWVKRSFIYTATAASTPISFTAVYTPGNMSLGLDNVQVRAIQPAAGTPGTVPASTSTSLQIGSATLVAGGKQTVSVTTAKGAALVIVVDYPDGTQVVAQAKAGADGHYSYTLAVPATAHGKVHVLVDSNGTAAQGSFSVN